MQAAVQMLLRVTVPSSTVISNLAGSLQPAQRDGEFSCGDQRFSVEPG